MKISDDASMMSFVFQGLTKINKVAPKKQKELKAEVAKALADLTKMHEAKVSSNNADKYFLPFKLACDKASSGELQCVAIDSINQLMAYGYLTGNSFVDVKVYPDDKKSEVAAEADGSNVPRRRLIDVIIETLYECSTYEDDAVALQVIKALLTAVTSVSCQVHEHSLLRAIQGCYNIFLMSHNPSNKTTAKATLTQMLNIVMQRMEHFSSQVQQLEKQAMERVDAPRSSQSASLEPQEAISLDLSRRTSLSTSSQPPSGVSQPPPLTQINTTPLSQVNTPSLSVSESPSPRAISPKDSIPAPESEGTPAPQRFQELSMELQARVLEILQTLADEERRDKLSSECGLSAEAVEELIAWHSTPEPSTVIHVAEEEKKVDAPVGVSEETPVTAADGASSAPLEDVSPATSEISKSSEALSDVPLDEQKGVTPNGVQSEGSDGAQHEVPNSLPLPAAAQSEVPNSLPAQSEVSNSLPEGAAQAEVSNSLPNGVHHETPADGSNGVPNNETSQLPNGVSDSVATTPNGTPASEPPSFCLVCKRPLAPGRIKVQLCSLECEIEHANNADGDTTPLSPSHRAQVLEKFEVLQRDAFLVFKALCKLSMKAIQGLDPMALPSKMLSLELLYSVLDNSGPCFRTSPLFIQLIKDDLVMSLLKNLVTPIESIFRFSSSIFLTMIKHFKSFLKAHIGVFLETIYLAVLASSNSTYEHKMMSLNVLSQLCKDPRTLVEIFLNYDCANRNVFQQIITHLEKIAQSMDNNLLNPKQAASLRRVALETLGFTMHSLVEWATQPDIIVSGGAPSMGMPPLVSLRPLVSPLPASACSCPSSSSSSSSSSTAKSIPKHSASSTSTSGSFSASSSLALPSAEPSPRSISPSSHEDMIDAAFEQTMSEWWTGLPSERRAELQKALEGPRETKSECMAKFELSEDQYEWALKHVIQPHIPVEDDAKREDLVEEGAGKTGSERPDFNKNFQQRREAQLMLERGIRKFNDNPNAGIKYLLEKGLIEYTPESVCKLFTSNPNIDKVQVGDWIGLPKEFNKKVLYYYVESLNFHKMTFDMALRMFLSGCFRLPREPEKIDRMMEKFADQYTIHNPGLFPSAESAYVLAYAIMMLNTDAHSDQVKEKMTRDQFLRNSSLEGDLKVDMLSKIYERVVATEIKMKDDPLAAPAQRPQLETNPKKRISTFMKESQLMVKRTQEQIKQLSKEKADSDTNKDLSADFYAATPQDIDAVEPMFEILWYPCLATLSVLLENTDNEQIVTQCLDGYRDAIRISALCNMDTPRLAFISSLKKFTLLGTGKEMKPKNIEATKMILTIATIEGNHLKESWGDVLECISEFERLRLTVSQPSVDIFRTTSGIEPDHPERISQFLQTKPTPAAQTIQSVNSRNLADSIEWSLVDRVFTQSANLNGEAIIDFVNHLRLISQQELSSPTAPRVFCLQKIVEITYYNMGRIRLVWSRIWKILSDFFVKAGCHTNLHVSMYAIDSLRQLAMKFLEKDELANYQFQKQFLKPFEFIMTNSRSSEVRELVLQCLMNMIRAKSDNVKSGWKSVFVVLACGAKDPHQPLVVSTFMIVQTIMEKYFVLITESTLTIDECINCLVAFGCNRYTDISLQAIEYLLDCASYLGGRTAQEAKEGKEGALEGSALKVWFLLLTGLSKMIGDPRLEVRSRSLQALFGTLHSHGSSFSLDTWRMIFHGVLFPIFDDVRHSEDHPLPPDSEDRVSTRSMFGTSWLHTTCLAALSTLVELFARFHDVVSPLLIEVLSLINNCIDQPDEEMGQIGVKCWVLLLHAAGPKFSSSDWDLVLKSLRTMFSDTTPHQLQGDDVRTLLQLPPKSSEDQSPIISLEGIDFSRIVLPFNMQNIITKCKVQLILMNSTYEALLHFYSAVPLPVAISPQVPPTPATTTSHEIAFSPEIVEAARRESTAGGMTRVVHGPAETPSTTINLSLSHMLAALEPLGQSVDFARSFNRDIELRTRLWRAGYLKHKPSPPELFYQEAHGLQIYMQLLLKLYLQNAEGSEEKMRTMSLFVLREYTSLVVSEAEPLLLQCMDQVLCTLLDGLLQFDDVQFSGAALLDPLVDLIQYGSPTVRTVLRKLFSNRLKKVLA